MSCLCPERCSPGGTRLLQNHQPKATKLLWNGSTVQMNGEGNLWFTTAWQQTCNYSQNELNLTDASRRWRRIIRSTSRWNDEEYQGTLKVPVDINGVENAPNVCAELHYEVECNSAGVTSALTIGTQSELGLRSWATQSHKLAKGRE